MIPGKYLPPCLSSQWAVAGHFEAIHSWTHLQLPRATAGSILSSRNDFSPRLACLNALLSFCALLDGRGHAKRLKETPPLVATISTFREPYHQVTSTWDSKFNGDVYAPASNPMMDGELAVDYK